MKTFHHLPDLPHAGYASKRQKETSDAIMFFMRGLERNRWLLLSIVVDGRDKWRKTAGQAWRGLLIDRELLDCIFDYFVLQAGENPAQQLVILHGMAEQEKRQMWDKRHSTALMLRKQQRQAIEDLQREQRRLTGRHTVSS